MSRYVIGITGASGSVLAAKLMRELLLRGHELFVTITRSGLIVMEQELGLALGNCPAVEQSKLLLDYLGVPGMLTCYDEDDVAAPIASGSFRVDGTVILPCSMGSVHAIASGASGNLLERAADVAIKEGRSLVVVPRETPLSRIHLKNLLTLAECGVKVMPPMLAFYAKPGSLEEALNQFTGRLLETMGLHSDTMPVWQGL